MGFLNRLLGTPEPAPRIADKYPPCPQGHESGWVAKSRAEFTVRRNIESVKQFFDCTTCGLRARLTRTIDSDTWSFYVSNQR